jgi:ribosomal protein L34E
MSDAFPGQMIRGRTPGQRPVRLFEHRRARYAAAPCVCVDVIHALNNYRAAFEADASVAQRRGRRAVFVGLLSQAEGGSAWHHIVSDR